MTENNTDLFQQWNTLVQNIERSFIDAQNVFRAICESDEQLAEVANALVDIHAFKTNVGLLYEDACGLMITKMANVPETTTAAGHLVEKKSGSDRKKWDHENLAKNVASRINDMAIDLETGEVTMSPQDMMLKLLDFAAVSYWRVKELGKIGISADEFCEVSEAKTNIIIRKAK